MNTSCTSCGMIEGFSQDEPGVNIEESMNKINRIQNFSPSTNVTPNLSPISAPTDPFLTTNDFMPYMQTGCNYGVQKCIYTAQGSIICPDSQGSSSCNMMNNN